MNQARSTLQDDGRGRSTMGRGPPVENPARTTTQKEDQLQAERKKHQEMVQQSAREKQANADSNKSESQDMSQKSTENRSLGDRVRSQTSQSTQEMTRSAAEASAKRAQKAQDASVSATRDEVTCIHLANLIISPDFFRVQLIDGIEAAE
jgi:hypothetical protein